MLELTNIKTTVNALLCANLFMQLNRDEKIIVIAEIALAAGYDISNPKEFKSWIDTNYGCISDYFFDDCF